MSIFHKDLYEEVLDGNPSVEQCQKIIGYINEDLHRAQIEINILNHLKKLTETLIQEHKNK